MKSNVFKFKKFDVRHGQSAMKVGTDGVLLGAWADVKGCKHILDIGSGSGLIALMLAQRNLEAYIDAVEIDPLAYEETVYNFAASPWSSRLRAFHTDIQGFTSSKKYDLIVSNPPYFKAGTNSPNQKRHIARHNQSLSSTNLLEATKTYLSYDGKACFILPTLEGEQFIDEAKVFDLHLNRLTTFVARAGKKPERLLLELGNKPTEPETKMLLHYNQDGSWSDDYIALTQAFYIKL